MSFSDLRLALFVSGGGTTMKAILEAWKAGMLDGIQPVLVVASKPNIGAIAKAEALGFSLHDNIVIIDRRACRDPNHFGELLLHHCKKKGVDVPGQYGWLPMTPSCFVQQYPHVINQHPGPLDPGNGDQHFGGKGMHGARVTDARRRFVEAVDREYWTEATAHLVTSDEEFDRGLLLRAWKVPINRGETTEVIQERLLKTEHAVQIATLRDLANGQLHPFSRHERLIQPGEEALLEQCKREAVAAYPHG